MWKTVSVNPKYEVNEAGEVRHRERKQILRGKIDRYGYRVITMSSGDRKKPQCVTAHRLVAMAFIPNPDGLPSVNHKDEDKLNNSVENLEWCSTLYNTRYGTGQQRSHDARKRPIVAIKDGAIVKRYACVGDAAAEVRVSTSSIKDGLRGKKWHISCRGFEWSYA
jgi:hypothetical protein